MSISFVLYPSGSIISMNKSDVRSVVTSLVFVLDSPARFVQFISNKKSALLGVSKKLNLSVISSE